MMISFPRKGPVIAIDGPAGSGKSSVSKRLAKRLGFLYIDTGALYRILALGCEEKRISFSSPQGQKQAAEFAHNCHIELKPDEKSKGEICFFLNGNEVSSKIRTPHISELASQVSAISEVRAALLGLQRKLGRQGKTILEGRDIGTVIFPDAEIKIFLTASAPIRAQRRYLQLKEKDQSPLPPVSEILSQMKKRDHRDQNREVAPLKKAPEAIEIDSDALSLEKVVLKIEKIIREKCHV